MSTNAFGASAVGLFTGDRGFVASLESRPPDVPEELRFETKPQYFQPILKKHITVSNELP